MYRTYRQPGNFSKMADRECRLMVVGKTGSGKSSLVNSIVGDDAACDVSVYGESMTSKPKMLSCFRFAKDLRVVDTPGLFDNRKDMTNRVILKSLSETALILAPGPHAILLTLVCGQRFTEEEQAVITQLRNFFGDVIFKHTIVVFTRGDDLENKGVLPRDYARHAPDELKALLEEVGGRYVVINNVTKNVSDRDATVRELLDQVEKMSSVASQPFFSSDVFREAEDQMALLDDAIARQFRPRSDSNSSQETLNDSMRRMQIQSILNADSGIGSQTSVPSEEELASKDKDELTDLAAKLVRLYNRNQVNKGEQVKAVEDMISKPALSELNRRLKKEFGNAPEEISNVKGIKKDVN